MTEPRQEVLHETLEEPIIIIDAEGRGDRALSPVPRACLSMEMALGPRSHV